ncbi:hypothetical protein [Ottowia sp.]|uniref:hypothetical protein n=1 Tax=Ottowia sp. TaxID=1898956 RepID=UPI0025E811E5|nr:hypothetical protein [Ottowia sp.]MBK6616360.1 hypothetical protein [Ottowia sp.]
MPPEGAVLVAIRNPRNQALDLEGWRDVLHVEFHDIDAPFGNFTMLGFRQALQIVEFINRHERAAMIAAHCDYGVSRSGAVAAFAGQVLGAALEKEAEGKNRLVYRRLMLAQAVYRLKAMDVAGVARALQLLVRKT